MVCRISNSVIVNVIIVITPGDPEVNGVHRFCSDDTPVDITATEFAVLEALMRQPGVLVTKDDLSQQALGRALMPFDRSLDTHISNLRRKLGPAPDGSPRIKTLRGRGYLFVRTEPVG